MVERLIQCRKKKEPDGYENMISKKHDLIEL